MKIYISIILSTIIFFACKKQDNKLDAPPPVRNDQYYYIANVEAYLKNNLSAADLISLDTGNMLLSKQGSMWFLRIGLANKKMSSDFILLQTDTVGNCSTGKFVHIRRDTADRTVFNGKISTESLQHERTVLKKVTNNVAQVLSCGEAEESIDAQDNDACDIVPSYDCEGCLPEVVVVGYVNSGAGGGGGISYSDYLNLVALVGASGSYSGSGSSGIYSPVIIPENPTLPVKPPLRPSPDITINYEAAYAKPGIDVNAFMKCFSSIPDAGATCSVTIFTDLPVNDDPSYIFNILTGATGHCFLQLTKTNGAQSVTQIVGKTTSKVLAVLAFPVAGKIVDNAAHKYNASLTMSLTPAQLQTEISAITAIGNNPQYDMWENNCVDYAVGILNKVRPSNPLEVIKLKDPSSGDLYNTPQGLYMALDEMKQGNGPEAKNIATDIVSHAGTSHGACN